MEIFTGLCVLLAIEVETSDVVEELRTNQLSQQLLHLRLVVNVFGAVLFSDAIDLKLLDLEKTCKTLVMRIALVKTSKIQEHSSVRSYLLLGIAPFSSHSLEKRNGLPTFHALVLFAARCLSGENVFCVQDSKQCHCLWALTLLYNVLQLEFCAVKVLVRDPELCSTELRRQITLLVASSRQVRLVVALGSTDDIILVMRLTRSEIPSVTHDSSRIRLLDSALCKLVHVGPVPPQQEVASKRGASQRLHVIELEGGLGVHSHGFLVERTECFVCGSEVAALIEIIQTEQSVCDARVWVELQ